jgi:adenosylhomocysteine nucleosidase
VVIPARWRYHSEAVYFNETAPGKFQLADWYPHKYPNFGMIHPDDVQVLRGGMQKYERMPSFPADEGLVALARTLASAAGGLPRMTMGNQVSQVKCGGVGVSGTVFCDNAEYRKWVFATFQADCLDMESAAIAQVCWQNETPCLIVRGLSDLAGGQTGKNQEEEFLHAAAEHAATVLVKILQAYRPPAEAAGRQVAPVAAPAPSPGSK